MGFSAARTTPGETIYGKLRRKYAKNRFNNRFYNPIMPTPPALTTSATQPGTGLTNITYFSPSGGTQVPAGVFRFRGGVPVWNTVNNHGIKFREGHSGTALTTCFGVSTLIEFLLDAPQLWIRFDNGAGGFKLIVDDQYVSAIKTVPGSTNIYVLIDFTAAGGRKMRKIGIDIESNVLGIHSIGMLPIDTLLPVGEGDEVNGGLIGDSFSTGTGAASQTDAYSKVLAAAFDMNMQVCGVGGTGWVNTSGGTQPTAAQVIYNLLPGVTWTTDSNYQSQPLEIFKPKDCFFFNHGFNDQGIPDTAAVLSIPKMLDGIAQVRAVHPTAPIFVFGLEAVWGAKPAYAAYPNALAYEIALLNAAANTGDPNVIPVPMMTDSAGPVLWGTGNSGAPTGDGNSDVMRDGTNGVHPPAIGHITLGFAEADRLIKAIAGKV